MSDAVKVVTGDITQLALDAIVNAANETLLGGAGVDGAIHRAAGPELLEHCRTLGGCKTGEAKITPGFRLPARYIIHTVGPIWRGGQHGEAGLLAACYRNAFRLARAHDLASIAFPAISCGVFGYPHAMAARIAVKACHDALQQQPAPVQILLVAFDADMTRTLHQALAVL